MRLWQLGLVGLWLAKVTRIRWYMVKGIASLRDAGIAVDVLNQSVSEKLNLNRFITFESLVIHTSC